jgi:hypothetical protein
MNALRHDDRNSGTEQDKKHQHIHFVDEGNDDIRLECDKLASDSQDTAQQIPDPVQRGWWCPSNLHAHPANAFRARVVIRVIARQRQQGHLSPLFQKIATQVSGNARCPVASKR